jgi:3-hydroxy-9,10-secoandrosta-1,3,5(10)-triene-9,17-dione monooxygenase reductase component
VGEIVDFQHSDRLPLIFHGGQYAGIVATSPSATPDDSNEPGALMELVGRVYHGLFINARKEFAQRGLSEESFFVLRILGASEKQPFDALVGMLSRAGRRLTQEVTRDLEQRGLISTTAADRLLGITNEGRRVLLELTAIRLSAEQSALANLDQSEITVIKELLRRLQPPDSVT